MNGTSGELALWAYDWNAIRWSTWIDRSFRVACWVAALLAGFLIMEIELHVPGGKGLVFFCIARILILWAVFLPGRGIALRLLLMHMGFTLFWAFAVDYMTFVDQAFPVKYDAILAGLDSRWLFNGDPIRRWLETAPDSREATDIVYWGIKYVVLGWYGWLCSTGQGANRFLLSMIAAYCIGPLFYMAVPACGPAFVSGHLPNCVPSLHMATALLMVAFRPKGGLVASVLFAAATAWATLGTGQHYVVDLVAALPFSVFVWASLERRWKLAGSMLAITACLVAAIHSLA